MAGSDDEQGHAEAERAAGRNHAATTRRPARRASGRARWARASSRPTSEDSDAPREMLAEDPQLGSSVLGQTTGSDEPATEEGIDLSAGDHADAVTDGGPDLPDEAEPDLKDVAAAARQADADASS